MRQEKTHCNFGHEYTKYNTYTDPGGRRSCRQCRKDRLELKRPKVYPKTHCVAGHEYTIENTRTNKRGERSCVKCRAIANARHNKRVLEWWRNRHDIIARLKVAEEMVEYYRATARTASVAS